ncbi:arylesterase [Paraburkholderia sp. UCT31]|uniref:arylesterase n=1 Tax=unclassified Paraburkholderia TaxID=2615204 RepID=UPI001616F10B|nr:MULTISPECIES: arylesterase [unclassified Paraburkholderia]MBC8737967.1 arylesterase [Paraburkholderia sp. UCT31]
MVKRRLKVRAIAPRAAALSAAFGATMMAAALVSLPLRAHAANTPEPAKPVIVVLGDSISAEYGLPRDTGWVALMRQRLAEERIDYSVANASISGDTTSGGRARLPALMERLKPSIVIVELGANDALRGVPLSTTEDNLRTIIEQAQQGHAKVVLVGMYVPPNYGPDYTQKFHGLYGQLSKEFHVPLVPFLLAGIADKPDMFQADQLHPTQQAQPLLLDNVWPAVKPLLRTSSPH